MSNEYMVQKLYQLCQNVPTPDQESATAAVTRLNQLTKPPGSLGALEALIVQLATITGNIQPTFAHPAVLVAAGDHGVVAEHVSPFPQSVTIQMVQNFLHGGAAINALAANAGARVIVVDAGVAGGLPDHPQLQRVAIGKGTNNLLHEPAMSRTEAMQAVLAGVELLEREREAGLDLLALGEMGIGNTTPAACLTSAFTGAAAALTTGRGTGLDDDGLSHKQQVVAAALDRAKPDQEDPLGILAELGGYEIALLAGATLAAATHCIPVVVDGYVATSAVLAAVALAPHTRDFLIAGHRSDEPGHRIALEHLGLQPLLTLDMRLGEGSGAALALPIIQGAAHVMRDMATFGEAGVDEKIA
ncbi:MAG: nicotinate-nucleotide--dimethylbenzimidazole phosphoribosyltransferase [Chloroflexi bacterium AL-W]|nr:nicotinate-nucleotide--dimethylbenzimidazole phosphoribosyltransferase [Chloroflexi bacterium AL-N1]NOK67888.1 nicotinate-nucleotide--dimethylbenzimidazole phosphoribosyltransferase [Chloroflexi bacterium AL-N10]NOK73228.1 nicotinate-nucleotide--dimethylbenzimidazole phosphoribosyltransferase [Chloroflexi bacterium AL-N5]NOK83143.1 nicotinate-nucleotide--dimethylbenzimidazole phosphoribosyltransferase [Chloroflexi bacterium AL-W]